MQKEEIQYERLRKEREDYEVFNRGGSKDYWAYTHCGGCYGVCGAKVVREKFLSQHFAARILDALKPLLDSSRSVAS